MGTSVSPCLKENSELREMGPMLTAVSPPTIVAPPSLVGRCRLTLSNPR